MTENELKELNERLAKAVKLKSFTDELGTVWKYEQTSEAGYRKGAMLMHKAPPNFTASMDDCIKWIWPYFWIIQMDTIDGIFYQFKLSHPKNPNSPVVGGLNENPATAFCLAADKYFSEVGK